MLKKSTCLESSYYQTSSLACQNWIINNEYKLISSAIERMILCWLQFIERFRIPIIIGMRHYRRRILYQRQS